MKMALYSKIVSKKGIFAPLNLVLNFKVSINEIEKRRVSDYDQKGDIIHSQVTH